MSVNENLFQLRMIIRSLHQEIQKCDKNYKACLAKAQKSKLDTEMNVHIQQACDHYINMLEDMEIISTIEQKIISLERASRSTIVNDIMIECTQKMNPNDIKKEDIEKLAVFFDESKHDQNPLSRERIVQQLTSQVEAQRERNHCLENLPVAPLF